MTWLTMGALLLVLSPTAATAYAEFKRKNLFGAVGIVVYLGLITALAAYQIFFR